VVVIGSANSSNTLALERTALVHGAPRALRVNGPDELPDDLTGTVGVIAGASAPESLVEAVVARLAPRNGVEEVRAVEEEQYFGPPPELRKLLASVAAFAAVAGLAPGADPTAGEGAAEDRDIGAADALAALGRRWPGLAGHSVGD
jgi:4-hydroxy-3-methylbut-2-enyl diphosphate reductase